MRLTFVRRPSVRRHDAASGTEPNRGAKPQLSGGRRAVTEDPFPRDPPSAAGGRRRCPPLSAEVRSAGPAEVRPIEPLLARRVLRRRPKRLIYDEAAGRDALRVRLARRCIDLICPHRKGRVRPALRDGRKLRRYKRRRKIERSISRLFDSRRPVVRYEHHAHLFLGPVQLACLYTTLRACDAVSIGQGARNGPLTSFFLSAGSRVAPEQAPSGPGRAKTRGNLTEKCITGSRRF